MSMEKQIGLVERLVQLTRVGELDWKEGPFPSSYQVSLASGSVVIRLVEKSESVAVQISLVNGSGDIVDSFDDDDLSRAEPAGGWFTIGTDLLDAARRTALGSEKLLESILGELDQKFF